MCRQERGFTIIELMAVVAVIAILAGLLLPSIARAKSKALSTVCIGNLKQFNLAHAIYSDENMAALLPNLDGRGRLLGETWVQGWLGVEGPDCTNVGFLSASLLAKTIKTPQSWRCPASSPVDIGGVRQLRVRTVSLNCFIGSPIDSPLAKSFRKTSDFTGLSPAAALSFFDESPNTINDASFAMQWDFDVNNSWGWTLRDRPGLNHDGAGTLGFMDGHIELRKWTKLVDLGPGRGDIILNANQDVLWMQVHGTERNPGVNETPKL